METISYAGAGTAAILDWAASVCARKERQAATAQTVSAINSVPAVSWLFIMFYPNRKPSMDYS
jgi:cob(I)alamin adenosyltransferase